MKTDQVRIQRYLAEMTKNSRELQTLLQEERITPDSLELKAVKYILIELAEAIANVLQHILAKEYGAAVNGYVDTIVKGANVGIISQQLFHKLKPFLDFRNSLIHRYWTIDDMLLIQNLHKGAQDFSQFVAEVERFMAAHQASETISSGNTPEGEHG